VNAAQVLAAGVRQLELDLPQEAPEKLLAYLELLQKWNRVYNLTAIRQPEQMVSHHLLDSLAVLPYLLEGRWLDVGCGGGLPGLVLAMARPQWQFTLLDSNSKKTGFVQQVAIDLKLNNVTVCCARAEDWQPAEKYDGIISRAFASLADFVSVTRHLLLEQGRWAAMKGEPSQEELRQLPAGVEIERTVPLKVPGMEAARCLVVLKTD
jgi:16S rRNA (guanine527-N7)-methyltransferase